LATDSSELKRSPALSSMASTARDGGQEMGVRRNNFLPHAGEGWGLFRLTRVFPALDDSGRAVLEFAVFSRVSHLPVPNLPESPRHVYPCQTLGAFLDLRNMPLSVPKVMSKQFRVYIVPSDIQSTLDHLRSKVGLRVLEETATGPKPIEVESPVRKRSTWIKARVISSLTSVQTSKCITSRGSRTG
jgi:hypothetical protein